MLKKMLILTLSIMLVAGISSNVLAGETTSNADSVAGASIETTTEDNSVNKVYNRQFVNPGNTPIPGTNGFFTAPTPDSSFRQVKELIFYLTGDANAISVNLTEGACEVLAKGGDVDANIQVVRDRLRVAKADQDGNRWITISYIAPIVQDGKIVGVKKEEPRIAGFVTAEADNADTDSFQVIGKAALKVIKAGLDHLQITAEGAHRGVMASGWGVGTFTTGAKVSDGGTVSGVVGGGLGYAQNEVQTEDQPWVQGNAGLGLVRNFDRAPVEYEAPVTK